MISTYLSYQSYAADLPKTLAPVASEAQISRDAQYYRDNIGKVTSVDDFIGNTRYQSVAETTVARLLATLPNSVVRHGELVNISGPLEGHLDDSLAIVWKCMLGRIGN